MSDAQLDPIIVEMKERQRCNRVMGCRGAAQLMALGPGVIDRLGKELADHPRDDGYWTTTFLDVLGQLGNARALPILERYLDDTRWEMNFAALRALGRLAGSLDTPTRERLAQRLSSTKTAPLAEIDVTRLSATQFALARLVPKERAEHEAAVLALLPMTREASEKLASPHLDAVVMLVTELKLAKGLPGIRWAALSPNRFVCVHALEALGQMRDTGGIAFAMQRLDDENPTIRKTAIAALQGITGAKSITTAEGWKDWATRNKVEPIPQ